MTDTDQISAKFATLSSTQIENLVHNYAEMLVDSMDTKTLMKFAYDTIVENLNTQSPDEILGQVSCTYDDIILEELIESVMV